MLRRQLEQMGMRIHLGQRTTAILGDGHVTGVLFEDGAMLDCDLVVVAAGIRPNVELAVRAGLTVESRHRRRRRSRVPADVDADVYAVGECAQHRGRVYGLVAPLWEQAQVSPIG